MSEYTELVNRLKWRANKYDKPGWLMPNCIIDLREAAAAIKELEAKCEAYDEAFSEISRGARQANNWELDRVIETERQRIKEMSNEQ